MAKPDDLVDIRKFLKPGKRMVVELDDEVEYILNEDAVEQMEAGKTNISVVRVIDRESMSVSARRIRWALFRDGVVDYLDSEVS